MTTPGIAYARVRDRSHRSAHLALPGSLTALCGTSPRTGEWTEASGFPECRGCASAARVADAVAGWDAPLRRAGVLALVYRGGCRRSVAECARCENVKVMRQRGLCQPCVRSATLDGTIEDYGWTRADRLVEYARHRGLGLNIREASERTGVSRRAGDRYEAELAGLQSRAVAGCRNYGARAAAEGIMTADPGRFDRDPEALAWARAKVRELEDRYQRLAESAGAARHPELAARFRHMAGELHAELIGNGGCVIAAFDERRAGLPPAPEGESG